MPGDGRPDRLRVRPVARKAATRGFQKVMDPCPYCGSRRPKELVEGPKRFRGCLYLAVSLLTCGLGLLFFPFFYTQHVEAWCSECEKTFHPGS